VLAFFVVVFGFDQKVVDRLERDFWAQVWMRLVLLRALFLLVYKSGRGLLIPALRLWYLVIELRTSLPTN